MSGVRAWWSGLSGRERRLVSVMLALIGGVLLWIGVWRPVRDGIDDGWARYGAAVDLDASVRAKLAVLRALPRAVDAPAALDQAVAQAASEAGLTLDRDTPQGNGRVAITIGSARAGAFLAWLSALEGRGITVETVSLSPGSTPGTVVVQALLATRR